VALRPWLSPGVPLSLADVTTGARGTSTVNSKSGFTNRNNGTASTFVSLLFTPSHAIGGGDLMR
jgi:hypothetical protein